MDEREAESYHVAAYIRDKIVGAGRLHKNSPSEGQIRWMAVEPTYQRRKIGSSIVAKLEEAARALKCTTIVLDARENAINFYLENGYEMLHDFIHHTGLPCKKMMNVFLIRSNQL